MDALDRENNPIHIGDKIKIVGTQDDSTDVYFTSEMIKYLNDGKIYIITNIYELSNERFTIHFKDLNGRFIDWSWACANILRIDAKPTEVNPIIFEYDPKHLDI